MRYRLKMKTDATVEPLTVAELKLHLRKDTSEEDDLIVSLGKAARRQVERWTSRSLVNQTWIMDLDGFPYERYIRLPRGPFGSLTSVKYYDEDGVQQTMPGTMYRTDTAGGEEAARITLRDGEEWPDTWLDVNAVAIEFVAGYGATAAAVPDTFKAAIKLLVGHWYENREAAGPAMAEAPLAVKALLYAEMEMEAVDV